MLDAADYSSGGLISVTFLRRIPVYIYRLLYLYPIISLCYLMLVHHFPFFRVFPGACGNKLVQFYRAQRSTEFF